MSRLSVLFLIRSLAIGGAERQLVEIARGLAARGHRVTVAVFYGGGELEPLIRGEGIELVHLGKKGRWDLLAFALRLRDAIRAANADILHTYLTGANLAGAGLKPFLGRTRFVAGVLSARFETRGYDRPTRLSIWLERHALRSADLVVTNSRAGRDSLCAKGAFAERIRIIANGIDTSTFRPDEAARERVRGQWGVEPGVPVIGIVARFDPLKDHATFLRAAATVAARRPDARFMVAGVGDAALRSSTRTLASELGLERSIIWQDGSEAIAPIYNALDVLVSSSLVEGFSNVIAEAMACGKPCVVTDVGDSAAVVGDTGRVVPARDPAALAEAIVSQLDHPRGPSPRARIVERFGVARLIDETERELLALKAG